MQQESLVRSFMRIGVGCKFRGQFAREWVFEKSSMVGFVTQFVKAFDILVLHPGM